MDYVGAYDNIPQEVVARYADEKLNAFFETHPDILKKVENGDVLTRADWEAVEKHKPFKKGYQIVGGYLVRVR